MVGWCGGEIGWCEVPARLERAFSWRGDWLVIGWFWCGCFVGWLVRVG